MATPDDRRYTEQHEWAQVQGPTGGTTTRQGGRPAQLFRAGGATLLNPPMLRPEV